MSNAEATRQFGAKLVGFYTGSVLTKLIDIGYELGLFEASRKRSERWERIARESSQQSRRTMLPEIAPAVRFVTALGTEAEARLFLEGGPAPPLLGAVGDYLEEICDFWEGICEPVIHYLI